MIEYNNKKYSLKYTVPRVEKIEKEVGKPLLSILINNKGVVSITDLRTLFIHGLRKEDGSYAGEKIESESFMPVLKRIGYALLLEQIVEAIQRDCPFFFQAD